MISPDTAPVPQRLGEGVQKAHADANQQPAGSDGCMHPEQSYAPLNRLAPQNPMARMAQDGL